MIAPVPVHCFSITFKDYSYLNRKKHKAEFSFAMIGCEIHVEIGQHCLSLNQNLNRSRHTFSTVSMSRALAREFQDVLRENNSMDSFKFELSFLDCHYNNDQIFNDVRT